MKRVLYTPSAYAATPLSRGDYTAYAFNVYVPSNKRGFRGVLSVLAKQIQKKSMNYSKKWKFISDPYAGESFIGIKILNYFKKMKGDSKSPPRVKFFEIIWSWLGAFIGISAIAYINYHLISDTDLVMIIGSFGASAVLAYGAISSPLAQPRNLVGGHIFSAIIGVTTYQIFQNHLWFAAAIAVATAIAAMHATKTLHPPGGATALIAVIGSDKIHTLGYMYILVPVGASALIMLLVALLINNIPKNRKYPMFWS